MEASRGAAITVEADITVDADHGSHVSEPARTAVIETIASDQRVITRQ